MKDQQIYDALPEKNPFPTDGKHKVEFVVEAPRDLPQSGMIFLSREEYDRLAEHSDKDAKVQLAELGTFPVYYDGESWSVAWDALDGYTYESPGEME